MEYTAVFEHENFLRLPAALCEAWGIRDDYDVYASLHEGDVLLSKRRTENTVAVVGVFIGLGITLPAHLVKTAELQVGHALSLTLEADVLRIKNTKVISLHSPVVRRILLDRKLQRELAASPFWGEMALEDIYRIITLHDWEPELTEQMLRMPKLLHAIACALHNEDLFYENHIRHVILQVVTNTVAEN